MVRFRHSLEYLFVAVCILGLLFTGYIVASSEASVLTPEPPQCGQPGSPGYPGYPGQDTCVYLPFVHGDNLPPVTPTPTQTPTPTPSPTPTATPNPYP
jgi:hypothetical protein